MEKFKIYNEYINRFYLAIHFSSLFVQQHKNSSPVRVIENSVLNTDFISSIL